MDYLQNLQKRYATKKFDVNYMLNAQTEDMLDQTLVLAPSSYGLQPYKFVKVKNPELRQKLRESSWDQSQVTDSSVFYVLCARKDVDQEMVKNYIEHIVSVRGVDKESLSGYEEMMTGAIQTMSEDQKIDWAKKQVYLALGFLLDAAAQNGLDSCPMEGFDPSAYSEILNLEEHNLVPTVACAIGMRSSEDETANWGKVRLGQDVLIVNM